MLKIFGAKWCPHCLKTKEFLEKNRIPFSWLDIETQPDDVVQKIIEVNGGDDWVVPTLEFNGKWREGKKFDPNGLIRDLTRMGVL